ncbi:far upstream element-binding protein 2 [Quercus suber]|uniref:Far upstream element-binding protein 2 n=1 Tax=Quercus suber TaxID=58331 RepID=A0AAW0KE56_QUESU
MSDTAFNKRKYDDQAAPSPDSAPPSYNAVAPPIEGKQLAQEVAEKGASGFDSHDSGFSSIPPDVKPHTMSKKIGIPKGRAAPPPATRRPTGFSAPITPHSPDSAPPSYNAVAPPIEGKQLAQEVAEKGASGFDSHESGFSSIPPDVKPHTMSKKIGIPKGRVGHIIGKGGETIGNLQTQSGAKIQITQDMNADSNSVTLTRLVELMGTPEQIAKAEQLIIDLLAKMPGGFGQVSQSSTGWSKRVVFGMKIPNNKNRVKNPSMAGCYPQQGYQAWPPTGWGKPGAPPFQQPGYGYVQVYPGPSPQYNMSQPPYSGYPPQPASGGYASNWDQSAVPPSQQTSQGGGNDYYSQPPPSQQQQTPGGPAAPADNSGYCYGQQQPLSYNQQGQGYTQDGYGGYQAQPQSGYGQPPSYDQQQGYASAPTYRNVTNPTQDGHAPSYGSQGDSTQAPPVQPSSVGQQGYTGYGPGYGAPQAQKPLTNPPVYEQPTQSPGGTLGGYGQPAPVQPGYPHSQPPAASYAQPDSGLQHAPPSNYGAAAGQPGYAKREHQLRA